MALNKAALAAVKAITKLKSGNIQDSYKQQRIAEDATSKLTVASPRCRIDDTFAKAKDGYEIPLKVFTPLDIDFSLKSGLHVSEDHKGTILYFHGGGWANGDVDFYTDSCMRTALKLERRVISVDYRRSPESKFPQAPEDCYEVARQLFAGMLIPDVDPEHIVLMGDSAGGDLTAVVSLMARDRQEFTPRTQVLLYPLTYNDHSLDTIFPSVIENGEDYLLTREDIEGYINLYLNGPEDYQNPYFAPLLAPSLANQPRTLVISAEYCPLRDEGETFAARIEADGGEAACYRMLDGVHGYFLYPSILSLVRDTYRIIQHFLDDEPLPEEEPPRWLELLGTD
ncbi:MAG: alpha/beta hydrolase [Eggerthellaceae bacterium]|nr:alpha/beta hydrolase [Eggerthellaceae bacterium]